MLGLSPEHFKAGEPYGIFTAALSVDVDVDASETEL